MALQYHIYKQIFETAENIKQTYSSLHGAVNVKTVEYAEKDVGCLNHTEHNQSQSHSVQKSYLGIMSRTKGFWVNFLLLPLDLAEKSVSA